MKVGFISDLHIDFNYKFRVIDTLIQLCLDNEVEALLIAGDISNEIALSESFVDEVSKATNIPIYRINGNHEFYDQPYNEKFHSESAYALTQNTILLTTTGWYDFTWDSIGRIDKLMKGKTSRGRWTDFRYIDWEPSKELRNGINPAIWYTEQCIDRLTKTWKEHNYFKNKIVMIHMVPHIELLGDMIGYYETNPFFGSQNMSNLIFNKIKPSLCLFGHTHFTYDKVIQGVRCVSRPLGYAGYEWNDLDEKMNKIFEVLEIK